MKWLLLVVLILVLAYPYILIGSLVVGFVARLANKRLDYAEESDQPLIFFGVALWPLLLVAGVIYVLTRRFVRWSVGLIPKLTEPPTPKPKSEWDE